MGRTATVSLPSSFAAVVPTRGPCLSLTPRLAALLARTPRRSSRLVLPLDMGVDDPAAGKLDPAATQLDSTVAEADVATKLNPAFGGVNSTAHSCPHEDARPAPPLLALPPLLHVLGPAPPPVPAVDLSAAPAATVIGARAGGPSRRRAPPPPPPPLDPLILLPASCDAPTPPGPSPLRPAGCNVVHGLRPTTLKIFGSQLVSTIQKGSSAALMLFCIRFQPRQHSLGSVADKMIPRQLCDSAGFGATDVLNKLRQKHAFGEGANYGVDINTG